LFTQGLVTTGFWFTQGLDKTGFWFTQGLVKTGFWFTQVSLYLILNAIGQGIGIYKISTIFLENGSCDIEYGEILKTK
jgi:hypothetical protein